MTNQDYQSSKWTNGEYTIEWANKDELKITSHSYYRDVSCHMDSRDFGCFLHAVFSTRNRQYTNKASINGKEYVITMHPDKQRIKIAEILGADGPPPDYLNDEDAMV